MPGTLKHRRKWLEAAAVVGVVILAIAALHALLHEVHIHDISHALHTLPVWRIGAALALTAFSYFILTFYDVLALRIIGRPLPYRTAALASLTSYTLRHNLGFALLTGGSARYRIYTAAGLEPADIVRIIAIASVTFWSGVIAMAGIALLTHSATMQLGSITLSLASQQAIGAGMIIILVTGMALRCFRRTPLAPFGWSIPRPSPRQTLAQPLLATLDLAAASAALFVLVPDAAAAQFPVFFLAYTLAMIVALVTHVRAGSGSSKR